MGDERIDNATAIAEWCMRHCAEVATAKEAQRSPGAMPGPKL
jgi:hypothetical protein